MTGLESLKAAAVLVAIGLSSIAPASGEQRLGAQGGEGSPNRRQEWLVPTQDQITPSRAVLFRPAGKGPFRLAVIAHASTQNRLQRAQMPQPEYPALAAALVARGFAVLVPQRLGHGKTGGPYLEDQEGCDNAEYAMSARSTAEAITTAMTFMRAQAFVRKDASVIVGHSAGGWGALALADQSPKSISSIIVFAPEAVEAAQNVAPEPVRKVRPPSPPAGLEDGKYQSRTKVGNYRPFRHRKGDNRTAPPGSRRGPVSTEAAE